MTTIQFAGLTFDDTTSSGFHIAELVGWYDAAPARYSADPRPQGNGSFRPGTTWRGARVVSIKGTWSGADVPSAYAARDLLSGMQADGQESLFVVTDPLGSRSTMASLSNAPQPDDGLFTPFFSFAFDVTCSDAYKYGTPLSNSTGVPTPSSGLVWNLGTASSGLYFDWGTPGNPGQATLTNVGTAQSWPSFTVGGGLSSGFTLTWVPTGAQIVCSYPVAAGSSVTIDSRTGRAILDGGSDITATLTTSQWWSVAPGQTGLVQFTPNGTQSGSPYLTAYLAPAYL